MVNFIKFLDNLKNVSNSELLEAIKNGYFAISESLSTDDANKPIDPAITFGIPSNAVDFNPNKEGEWFDNTLPKNISEKVTKAQVSGKKVGVYPSVGTAPQLNDPKDSQFGAYQNANTSSGNEVWAGDSGTGYGGGGYNLGG